MNKKQLENNYERNVYSTDDKINEKDKLRYLFALENIKQPKILEIGSGCGYGLQFFKDIKDLNYLGIDNNKEVVKFANKEYGNHFKVADINEYKFDYYDTIIAFEVIEHLINGLEIVEKLKKHCDVLLISVPYDEPKGYWGRTSCTTSSNRKKF